MTPYPCPKGHLSSESDYCSECGSKLSASDSSLDPPRPVPSVVTTLQTSPAIAGQNPRAGSSETIVCPSCQAVHQFSEGDFCEICGYNFVTGKSADWPIETLPVPTPASHAAPIAPTSPATVPPLPQPGWCVVIRIDPSLALPESPPPPQQEPIVRSLQPGTHLIGRTSVARAVTPEIALDFDDAVSHRHALLIVQENGSVYLRDIGSSNGTQMAGKDVTVMADTPLKDGDEFSLGHWTVIRLESRSTT